MLSCTALGAGAALGAAAALAGPNRGGWTFRVSQGGPDLDYFDPARSVNISPVDWAICAKLFNYPDRGGRRGARLVPEVAAGFPRISRDGKLYTFTIRPGFHFNTGARVTAANFAYAINRDLNPQMRSPAAGFLTDVVGASDVIAGKAKTASGVRAHGNTLTIRLASRAPDIVARLAMPYFCSIPTNLPINPSGVVTPSAGPYFISHFDQNTVVLARNPFYHGNRPRNPARIVWSFNQPFDSLVLEVERGDADTASIAPAATAEVAKQYPHQLHQAPGISVACLALNSDRPLFHNNPALRKAVSYAIDRRALAAQFGLFVGRVTDHYIPYDMPGYRKAHIYPLRRPDFHKARALAHGHLRAGAHAIMYVRNASTTAIARAQIVRQDLAQIGISVDIVAASPQRDPSRRGEPFDIVDSGCTFAQYLDPYAILNLSFDGRLIRPTGNTNVAYFNDPRFNRRLEAAARLRGRARSRAYGKIDVDLAREQAPAVAYATFQTFPVFVSRRIGCVQINPLFGLSYGALCLKKS